MSGLRSPTQSATSGNSHRNDSPAYSTTRTVGKLVGDRPQPVADVERAEEVARLPLVDEAALGALREGREPPAIDRPLEAARAAPLADGAKARSPSAHVLTLKMPYNAATLKSRLGDQAAMRGGSIAVSPMNANNRVAT